MNCAIHILDEKTINQIAAGEVIENSASVVKELVENALDAGASRVFVEVQGGGQQLIRVQDNGFGMTPEEAKLAILRHATSKIRSADDLFSLATMGFRGEALASIAAVSEFKLMTAKQGTEAVTLGTCVVIQGGTFVSSTPCMALKGTTIEVRSLFFNTPARKKFQKSPQRDGVEIAKVMTMIALAHPDKEFEVIINGKKEFLVQPSSLQERMKALLGNEYAKEMVPIEYTFSVGDLEGTFSGFVGVAHQSIPHLNCVLIVDNPILAATDLWGM